MAKCRKLLLGLIILDLFLAGISGAGETHVFCSSGENVRLPCNNALSDCKPTTWIYNRDTNTPAVELITSGVKKKNTERHKRLSLESDCSLNIKKVTKEDYGFYTCQQYVNGKQYGTDARVNLHRLRVSSSSPQSEIRSGRSVTLSCQLKLYNGVSCDTLVRTEGIQLIWVNQANVSVMTDSRYQILFSSSHCNSTLTTRLLNEDHNRQWRCQLTQRNKPKTSASYTVKYSDVTTNTLNPVSSSTTTIETPVTPSEQASSRATTLIPASASNSLNPVIVVVVVVAVLAVLIPAVILWVIRKRKVDNRRENNDPVELKDDVTYTEITHSENQAKKKKVSDDDEVTYSSIRGGKAEPQDNCSQLYASVNKNRL